MKKTVPLSIPNKKINYSPQYRNMVEGENIVFGQEGKRVETINTDVIELLKVRTPEVIQEGNTIVATCATDGAVIFYTDDGSTPTVMSTVYSGPVTIVNGRTYTFFAAKNGMVESETIEIHPAFEANYLKFTAYHPVAIDLHSVLTFESTLDSAPNLEISYDGVDFQNWEYTEENGKYTFGKIDLTYGEFVYVRGINTSFNKPLNLPYETTPTSRFRTNQGAGWFQVTGDITSLLNGSGGDVDLTPYCLAGLFYNADILTSPNLPSTKLDTGCYALLFAGTLLEEAPVLHAEEMKEWCYAFMFNGSNLTSAPELKSTNLSFGCYYAMFAACSGLLSPCELPATIMKEMCYADMFFSTGIINPPAIMATQLADSCMANMFASSVNLVKSPILYSEILDDGCYFGMFNGCSSLNEVTVLATSIKTGVSGPTNYWLNYVSASGVFKMKKGSEIWTTGINGIPENWTIEEIE